MSQEEKDLLLKDLCGRLPHGVKFLRESWNYEWDQELSVTEVLEDIDKDGYINNSKVYKVEDIKPYLRPMSSMTEEECDMVEEILGDKCIFDFIGNGDIILKQGQFSQNKLAELYDYYNSIHVDYRGLIEKGLAVAVTEENNPYKQ